MTKRQLSSNITERFETLASFHYGATNFDESEGGRRTLEIDNLTFEWSRTGHDIYSPIVRPADRNANKAYTDLYDRALAMEKQLQLAMNDAVTQMTAKYNTENS